MHPIRVRETDFNLTKAIKRVTGLTYTEIYSQSLEMFRENLPAKQRSSVKEADAELNQQGGK